MHLTPPHRGSLKVRYIKMKNNELAGEWIFHGHPWGSPFPGQIHLCLNQNGTQLTGTLQQAISPQTGEPVANPEATKANITGELIVSAQGSDLVVLQRTNIHDSFRAIFSGIINQDCNSIGGTFVNSNGDCGTFKMIRKKTNQEWT